MYVLVTGVLSLSWSLGRTVTVEVPAAAGVIRTP